VAIALDGHAAEHIVFGETSTDSADDIQEASTIARDMVERYGMSERLGTVALARDGNPLTLGVCSEKTAESIDEEIRRILHEAYFQATSIITCHRGVLERVAQALIERETLQGDELDGLFSD
jgi:cell division protease FtsH